MRLGKNNFLLSIILALSIIATTGLLSGCALNYSNAFSIKTPPSTDAKGESSNKNEASDVNNNDKDLETKDLSPVDNSNKNATASTQEENSPKDKDNITPKNKDKKYNDGKINEGRINNSIPGKSTPQDTNGNKGKGSHTTGRPADNMTDIGNGPHSNYTPGPSEVQGNIQDERDPEKEMAIPAAKIIRDSTDKETKQVAITFDDGPDGQFTPQILDILKKYDTKATFFILGTNGEKHKDVLKRIGDEGHVVASHGWGHKNFTKLSQSKAIEELQRTDDLIKEVVGESNQLFRLPYGAFNKNVLKTVADQGYYNIYWSIDPRDWSGISPKEILGGVKENLEPGAIILLHSSGSAKSIPNTVKALPSIIEFLKEQGYEIVTIPELLEDTLYE